GKLHPALRPSASSVLRSQPVGSAECSALAFHSLWRKITTASAAPTWIAPSLVRRKFRPMRLCFWRLSLKSRKRSQLASRPRASALVFRHRLLGQFPEERKRIGFVVGSLDHHKDRRAEQQCLNYRVQVHSGDSAEERPHPLVFQQPRHKQVQPLEP